MVNSSCKAQPSNQPRFYTRWRFQIFFYFHRYLGSIPILTNIFQRGWNHQLVYDWMCFFLEDTKSLTLSRWVLDQNPASLLYTILNILRILNTNWNNHYAIIVTIPINESVYNITHRIHVYGICIPLKSTKCKCRYIIFYRLTWILRVMGMSLAEAQRSPACSCQCPRTAKIARFQRTLDFGPMVG